MMKPWTAVVLLCCTWAAHAQSVVQYRLNYPSAGSRSVQVRIDLPSPRPAPLTLVMPRTLPGGYELVLYDSFVQDVRAFSADGKALAVTRPPFGPRWFLGAAGTQVARIEYSVDVARMEEVIPDEVNSSKLRPRYAGLLGYSVFAFLDGQEEAKIALQVEGPKDWPVYSTLNPTVPAALHTATAQAPNYYALADSQVLMGPALHLQRMEGPIALVMATYSEGGADTTSETELAHTALERVQRYFGDAPFKAYTVQLEILTPLAGHSYDFNQEHIDSGTFIKSVQGSAPTPEQQQSSLVGYAHHMAHSWIPKRAYGEGYLPFMWEMPPVIDTIWFNEGFGRYAGMAALADGMPKEQGAEFLHRGVDRLRKVVNDAPEYIGRMSTVQLSREASFMYAVDFTVGMNTYSRGSVMAAEMDERIRQQSQGKCSLKDALRAIVQHVQQQKHAFKEDELAPVFRQATGVDVSDILQKWMQPTIH